MTLPIDMKKLREAVSRATGYRVGKKTQGTTAYPKVAPEPSMYWPSVLMMPLGPAPYLKMLTVPELELDHPVTF